MLTRRGSVRSEGHPGGEKDDLYDPRVDRVPGGQFLHFPIEHLPQLGERLGGQPQHPVGDARWFQPFLAEPPGGDATPSWRPPPLLVTWNDFGMRAQRLLNTIINYSNRPLPPAGGTVISPYVGLWDDQDGFLPTRPAATAPAPTPATASPSLTDGPPSVPRISTHVQDFLHLLGLVTTLLACAASGESAPHPYVGMWVTADGRIRQELLPSGRYEEERDGRKRAYTGRYTVTGTHIHYQDDLGFTATGDVRDNVLYHEHLVLYRES